MLTLTSRKKLPRFQNVIDQVRLFNLRIQIQMQCQFHLIEDLSKATAYFPIHGFRYPYPLHHRLLGRLFVLFSRWHQHQCFLFVFLFCILVLFLFFFFLVVLWFVARVWCSHRWLIWFWLQVSYFGSRSLSSGFRVGFVSLSQIMYL